MDRITGKQVQSMMESLNQVYAQPEVEQLNEGPADDPRWGVLGQAERLRRRMFGTADEVKDAASYEASINALTKSRGPGNVPLGADGKPITAAQISAETKRRRLADPNYKGQRSSTQTQTAVPPQLGAPDKAGSRKRYGNTTYEVQNGKWVPLSASQVTGSTPVRPAAGGTAPVRPAGGLAADRTSSAPAPAPTFKVGDKQMTKAEINKEYDRLRNSKDPAERNRAAQFGKDANRAVFKPNTATTPGGTKFERRAPTSAELKAAQAARAKGLGDEGAAKAAAQVRDKAAQPAARPAATSFNPNAPRVVPTAPRPTAGAAAVARPAAGTPAPKFNPNAPRVVPTAPRPTAGAAAVARPAAAPAPRPTAAAPAPRPTAAAPAPRPTAAAPAPKVETKKKQPLQQSADLFDIIKGYLIDEGATEEEALKKMLTLTDEERTEIIEGSCGSKSKKKNSKKGGY